MPLKDSSKRKEYSKQYRLNNLKKLKEKEKQYRDTHKEIKKKSDKLYRDTHKDKIKQYQTNYKTRDGYDIIRKKICSKYRKLHKDRIKETNKKYNAKPDVRMRILLRKRIQMALKNVGSKNYTKTVDFIGCSYKECREHIEKQFKPGMSWENYGKNGWHIDHIRPCASFDLSDPNQQKECFHYTNLQPLWAYENLSKGAKWLTSPASHDGCGRVHASPDDPCGCGWSAEAQSHESSCEGSGRR